MTIPERYPHREARNALGESLPRPLLPISLSCGYRRFSRSTPILLRKQRFAKKRDSRSARKQHQGRALTRPMRETEDQRLREQREQSTEVLEGTERQRHPKPEVEVTYTGIAVVAGRRAREVQMVVPRTAAQGASIITVNSTRISGFILS